jgi:hypothetical protein
MTSFLPSLAYPTSNRRVDRVFSRDRYVLASTIGVGLASLDRDDPAVWPSIQVVDRKGHELRPPECTEEADQHQGAIPDRCEVVRYPATILGQHIYIEGRGSVRPSTVHPADAPEDIAKGVFGWVRMADSVVGIGNCSRTPSQCCGCQRVGRSEIRRHCLR